MAEWLLADLPKGAHVLADKRYDADWIRELIEDQDCTPHIPPRRHRYDGITYSKKRYKQRNLIERCFNKIKQFRHIAMRFDHIPGDRWRPVPIQWGRQEAGNAQPWSSVP